ncbi:MAG: zinc-binding dehydrogenase, partial [Actinobacteria bacterium]|nr:zinc-binding dehydrogenase [Actinomycetota bacterium]
DTAVVIGVGGVGLNVIQGLKIANAGRIIAVDAEPSKEGLARQFGATDFIDARSVDAVEAVRELFPYHPKMVKGPLGAGGVDWAFECVGNTRLLNQAVAMLDWGGTAVEVGVPGFTDDVAFHAVDLVQVNRTVKGSRYGGSRPQHDIPLYAQWYLDGKLKLDELVTEVVPVPEFAEVIADMHDGKLARGVLEF